MWRTDGNKHAGLADFKAAEAMDDGNTVDSEFFVEKLADLAHFLQGHRVVGFVFEVTGLAAVRFIADEAIEGNDGAIEIGADKIS